MKLNTSFALGAAALLAAALLGRRAAATGQPANSQPAVSRIALVNFEQVVLTSNEGQAATAKTLKKFDSSQAKAGFASGLSCRG